MTLSPEDMDGILGPNLANEIATQIRKYVVLDDEHRDTVTLWVLHCWALDAFFTTGRLLITSPEPNCGKSILLSMIQELVDNPVKSASLSPSYIYRKLDEARMTFLLDEIDKNGIGNKKRTRSESDDLLLAILNEGYRRKGQIGRCVGTKHTPTEFKVFAPVALAGISSELDGPFMTRTIRVALERHMSSERPARFRESERLDREFAAIRERCQTWAGMHTDALHAMDEDWDPPEWMTGRQAECWGPLLLIAAKLGGEWPARADKAVKRALLSHEPERTSAAQELLMATQRVFEDREFLSCQDIAHDLNHLEESPCTDWNKGSGITVRQVGLNLSKYGIKSTTDSSGSTRGYRREQFLEAWERYVEPTVESYDEQLALRVNKMTSTPYPLTTTSSVGTVGDASDQGNLPTLPLSPTNGSVGAPTVRSVGTTDDEGSSDRPSVGEHSSSVGTDGYDDEEPF